MFAFFPHDPMKYGSASQLDVYKGFDWKQWNIVLFSVSWNISPFFNYFFTNYFLFFCHQISLKYSITTLPSVTALMYSINNTTYRAQELVVSLPHNATVPRRPYKPTEMWQRVTFVSMWNEGESSLSIARKTGVSPSTVNRWIRRWKQEGHVYSRIHQSNWSKIAAHKYKWLGRYPAATNTII